MQRSWDSGQHRLSSVVVSAGGGDAKRWCPGWLNSCAPVILALALEKLGQLAPTAEVLQD